MQFSVACVLLCRGDPGDRPMGAQGRANTRFAPTLDLGLIQVKFAIISQERELVLRGALLLRGSVSLPSPEAVRALFYLLAQLNEQLTVAVENESRRRGHTNEKAKEEHKWNPPENACSPFDKLRANGEGLSLVKNLPFRLSRSKHESSLMKPWL